MELPPTTFRSLGMPPRPDVQTIVDALRHLGAFPDIDDAGLRLIAQASTPVSIPAGWSLIWEGTGADKAYLLLSGTAAVRREGREIAQVGPGELVGERAILQHKLRNATVVATTPLEMLHFTREAVEQLCSDVPAFCSAVESSVMAREEGPQ